MVTIKLVMTMGYDYVAAAVVVIVVVVVVLRCWLKYCCVLDFRTGGYCVVVVIIVLRCSNEKRSFPRKRKKLSMTSLGTISPVGYRYRQYGHFSGS
jgi:hypothetical protein